MSQVEWRSWGVHLQNALDAIRWRPMNDEETMFLGDVLKALNVVGNFNQPFKLKSETNLDYLSRLLDFGGFNDMLENYTKNNAWSLIKSLQGDHAVTCYKALLAQRGWLDGPN